MRSIFVTLSVLVSSFMVACAGSSSSSAAWGTGGSSADSSLSREDAIGKPCDNDNTCGFELYCPMGTCTQDCIVHSDCGCPTNTTDGDIAAGKCKAACVVVTDDWSLCLRVCTSSSQCEGSTSCEAAEAFNVCV
jgi:hypothetical protein